MSTHLAQRPRPVVPPILILLPVVVVLAATADPARPAEPSLIPWPRSRVEAPGLLPLGEASRIVAADPSLVPLAEVLAGEIEQVFGRSPGLAGVGARAGDIVLEIDPTLTGEAYRLDVGDRAVVRGGGYRAIALGTTTVLQSLVEAPGGLALPKGAIQDAPRYRMRAVQMCIKHQVHDISMLRQGVDLCRMYKLDVLALHLSNYQVLWLLSPAFRVDPLPKGNFDGGATYEPAEIAELVEYARRRGVEILPEWGPTDFLFPGLMMEWLFKAEGSRLGAYGEFDAAKRTLLDDPRYWEAIDDLTRRLAAAFPHSEYIHVGAVDGETAQFEGAPDRAFMKANGLRGSADVWGWLLARLCDIGAKHGKRTMAFEGVRRDAAAHAKVPKDVAFFAYQTWYYPADEMLADGYSVLNAAWRPLYTCGDYPAREIYAWNPRIVRHNADDRIDILLPESDRLLGSLLSTWEVGEVGHMELLRDRAAAMAERAWNPDAGRTWDDFRGRQAETSRRLLRIQLPLDIEVSGLTADTRFYPLDERWRAGTECYAEKAVIALRPRRPDAKVYYTLQDPYFIWSPERPGPTNPKARLYEVPIELSGGAAILRARCFDASGRPVGGEFVKWYQHVPVRIGVEGAERRFDSRGRASPLTFHGNATVTFSTPRAGERLRYRTSPPEAVPPTPDIEYSGPIAIDDTTTFWVGLGKEGYCLTTTIRSDGFQEGLLTSGRAKASATGARQIGDPTLVVDGFAGNPDAHWNGIGEASLTIELVEPSRMNELQVFCWWGDGRAYRYTVEVLPDGEGWRPLVDMSENTMPSGPEGYSHRFETMAVKALRFHVLGNTVNDHGHLCEVRAREARAPEVPASR